jgi:hypothetical protein
VHWLQITTAHTGERIKLNELLNAWAAAVGSRNMMGGNEPNMADLAVYGAINSLEDVATFREIMTQVRLSVCPCLRPAAFVFLVRAFLLSVDVFAHRSDPSSLELAWALVREQEREKREAAWERASA